MNDTTLTINYAVQSNGLLGNKVSSKSLQIDSRDAGVVLSRQTVYEQLELFVQDALKDFSAALRFEPLQKADAPNCCNNHS